MTTQSVWIIEFRRRSTSNRIVGHPWISTSWTNNAESFGNESEAQQEARWRTYASHTLEYRAVEYMRKEPA